MSNMFFRKKNKKIKPKYIEKILDNNNSNKQIKHLGNKRHFPPANIEWSNSIYHFNKNYVKILPGFEKIINKLIKGYFYLHHVKKQKKHVLKKEIPRIRRKRIRYKRLSTNRIFVSNADVKHTNKKAIITVYIYNGEKRYILNKINKNKFNFLLNFHTLSKKNFFRLPKVEKKIQFVKKQEKQLQEKLLVEKQLKKKLQLKEKLKLVREKKLQLQVKIQKSLQQLVKKKLIKIKKINSKANKYILLIKKILIKLKRKQYEMYQYTSGLKQIDPYLVIHQYKRYLQKSFKKEKLYIYYNYLLWLNKSKFENTNLNPFILYLKKFFINKKIYFNLVNLKYLYLNTNIFSQILIIKLKNRKIGWLRVLNLFLSMVKLPIFNKLSKTFTRINRTEETIKNAKSFKNLTNALSLKTPQNNLINNDLLNQRLKRLFNQKKLKSRKSQNNYFLFKTIYKKIKHKTIIGVRLEVKGRLTKRLIAARSIFKFRYKGSLKDINSSYNGLSTVLLRGYIKSNLQYTNINDKRRIGSFGLKGWLSTL